MILDIAFFIIFLPFLFINYQIIKSDFKEKKIPNKSLWQLLILIPFWWIYLFFLFPEINFILYIFHISISIIISFILFYYKWWAAWDAKYLLVLALFIPYIGIVPFIGNLAILIIVYLLLYFLYLYLIKSIINPKYWKSLYLDIYKDLKDKLINFLQDEEGNLKRKIIIKKIFKWLFIFLIVFVALRIIRRIIIHYINPEEWWWTLQFMAYIINEYHIYLLCLIIWIIIWIMYFIWYIWEKFSNFIIKKSNNKLDKEKIKLFLAKILLIFIIIYIIYEYFEDYNWLKTSLYLIFTIYLFIYILIKFLIYMYKVSFSIAEQYYIDIKDLKEWDIIDKIYLNKIFWKQEWINSYILNKYKVNPNIFFLEKIKNPINEETKIEIEQIYLIIDDFHKSNNTNKYSKIEQIKIQKNFAFWIYIYIWFFITLLIWNTIFEYIIQLIKNIYQYFN